MGPKPNLSLFSVSFLTFTHEDRYGGARTHTRHTPLNTSTHAPIQIHRHTLVFSQLPLVTGCHWPGPPTLCLSDLKNRTIWERRRKSRKMVMLVWGLLVLSVAAASPPRHARQAELDNYYSNNYDVDLDVNILDFDEPQIGTLSLDEDSDPSNSAYIEEEEEEAEQKPKPRWTVEDREVPMAPHHIPSGFGESGTLMGPHAQGDMPTCVLCMCLGGSVYCDDLRLDRVPPLPKETTHFYARYNKIAKISKSDFANLNKLKKIDLTSNAISKIDDDAFFGLPALDEVILRENNIRQLPALPTSMTLIDACHNQLGSTGIHREAFKDMPGLLYLYLTDNNIDHIPVPLPHSLRSLHLQNNNVQMMHDDTFCNPHDLNYIRNALEDVRLDGNPINLSRTPQAFICLPRIPVGNLI